MKNKVEELAKFMHNEYEKLAKKFEWQTNAQCRVSFENLPETNKKTMISLAESVLKRLKVENENK